MTNTPLSPSDLAHFHEAIPRLRTIFSRRTEAMAGGLRLLNLAATRDRLGPRWGEVAPRVMTALEELLETTLGPDDVWFRYGQDRFFVVFAHLEDAAATQVCQELAARAQARFHEDHDTAELGVGVAVEPLAQADILHATGLMPPAPTLPTTPLEEGEGEGNAMTVPAPTLRFRPLWDVRHQALAIAIVRPWRAGRGGANVWGYACARPPGDSAAVRDLDFTVLETAQQRFMALYQRRRHCFLLLPVHFETLATQSRRQPYLQRLGEAPRPFCRFLLPCLVGLPPGVPASRVGDIVGALRPFSRRVLAEVDPLGQVQDLVALANGGIAIVHIRLPPHAHARHWAAPLHHFCHEAAKRQLKVSAEGADTTEMEACLRVAGSAYEAGELIGGWADAPGPLLRFELADLRPPVADHSPDPASLGPENLSRESRCAG